MAGGNGTARRTNGIRITGTIGELPVELSVEGLDLVIPSAVAGLLSEYVRIDTTRDRTHFAKRVVQIADAIKVAKAQQR